MPINYSPYLRSGVCHLLALIGSTLLLLVTLFVAARFLYPPLLQLADRISAVESTGFVMMPTVEWRFILGMILVVDLLSRIRKPNAIWLTTPLVVLICALLGFILVGIDNWSGFQAREYDPILIALMQGLHFGLWGVFYWLLYKFSLQWQQAPQ